MKMDAYRVKACGAELNAIYYRMAELARAAAPLNDQLAEEMKKAVPMSETEIMIRDLILGRPGADRFKQLALLAHEVSCIRVPVMAETACASMCEVPA